MCTLVFTQVALQNDFASGPKCQTREHYESILRRLKHFLMGFNMALSLYSHSQLYVTIEVAVEDES